MLFYCISKSHYILFFLFYTSASFFIHTIFSGRTFVVCIVLSVLDFILCCVLNFFCAIFIIFYFIISHFTALFFLLRQYFLFSAIIEIFVLGRHDRRHSFFFQMYYAVCDSVHLLFF